jgi:hypothetical protein
MTPTVKDPIIVELKRICETQLAVPTTFREAADFSEADKLADDLTPQQFPVLFFLNSPGGNNEIGESNEIERTITMDVLLLNTAADPTAEYAAAEKNPMIYQMHRLGQNLSYWLNKSPISINGGTDKWKNENVYAMFDANLFGQRLKFEWNVRTGTTGYYNNPGQQI